MLAREPEPPDIVAGLIVIGSGPAGKASAEAYREAGGAGRVVIVTADEAPPYDRPPLSKAFLRGESDADALAMESPSFYTDHRIELLVGEPATALDSSRAVVTTGSGRTIGFGRCIIATGCRPADLPVPGADHPAVMGLRSLRQGQTLRDAAQTASTAVVVGSGFIGCEAAASLAIRGVDVTMVTAEERPQSARLGQHAAGRLTEWLADSGVRVMAAAEVAEILDGTTLLTDDGARVRGDLLLSAAGVVPLSEIGERAGLRMDQNRIVVDEHMATNCPGIFAAGDVVLAHNAAAGRALRVEHWGDALRMGEVAGHCAAGQSDSWAEVPGFWSEIGDRILKYAAWGDGFDRDDFVQHKDGGFTVWYSTAGIVVGVLTHQADGDYDRGSQLILIGGQVPLPSLSRTT
jgi:NADPH-dependent 2,4-dienoyl-CoA reductase/sulfur reductase-like enzyme